MNKLHTMAVRKWLIKRFRQSANQYYIVDQKEEQYKSELDKLFAKFDQEGKGRICKTELVCLLTKYGIEINEQELTSYIKSANTKSGRFLTVQQFKQCVLQEKSKSFLRNLIGKSNERNPNKFVPTDITKILSQVHYLSQRSRLLSQIEDKHIPVEQKLQPLTQLIDLSREVTNIPHLRLPRAKSTCTSNYNSVSTTNTLPSTTRFDSRISWRRHPTICCE